MLLRRRVLLFICLACWYVLLPFWGRCADTDGSLDPALLAKKYEEALAPYQRMKGTWTNRRRNSKAGHELQWSGVTEKLTVIRDSARAKVLMTESGGAHKPPRDYEVVSLQGKTWFGIYPNDAVLSNLTVYWP